jgi:hypothetical protein
MLQDETSPSTIWSGRLPFPIWNPVARCGSAAEADADRARDTGAGAGGGGAERLGFLVSAWERSPGSGGSEPRVRVWRRAPATSAAGESRAGTQAGQIPGTGCGRRPLLGNYRARGVLPPLQVEVVAGNRHINVPAKSNAIHLDVELARRLRPRALRQRRRADW